MRIFSGTAIAIGLASAMPLITGVHSEAEAATRLVRANWGHGSGIHGAWVPGHVVDCLAAGPVVRIPDYGPHKEAYYPTMAYDDGLYPGNGPYCGGYERGAYRVGGTNR
jgi:hypothetical protein